MSLLSVSNLSVKLRDTPVFHDVTFDIQEGEFVGLIGPNGAGKTTLMRAALGLLPFAGKCSLADVSEVDRGRYAAWMPQAREIAWPVSVEAVVTLGRTPYLASVQTPGPDDRKKVDDAIAKMDLLEMRHRPATELSGGEQARVLIARALAQDTPLLLADEPIAGLDPAHQIATMETFSNLALQGKSSLVSLHDLGLAARHCSRLLLLGNGGLVADGLPQDVLTPELLAEVFGISAWFQNTDAGPVYQSLKVLR